MQWTALAFAASLFMSGLAIKESAPGAGPGAKAGQWVTVNYTGKLTSGKVFDSSLQPDREPFVFHLGAHQVIKGWDMGLLGMKVGAKRTLTIPPSMAYGSRNIGNGLIPPNSTLIFDVEMVKISDTAPGGQQ